ncbi:hypothetical protein EHF33_11195 [Deinococcus psychrotolerans]|uniref:EF-hand domain-containing protein n=2 Tax=Deinococcus TaxID=1298 RepID=A0A553UQV1_9DEIO|nr:MULTISPECIES: hypothetical protein [Deinococcus]AZI43932.1 hypothetical protein EHF33_11195 [Deinococcus psychrotolerans]TSA82597.1 hypothetical protein FNU79_13270 [Deinococcus detaillensis]
MHQRMSQAADPRDTNGDGVVSPEEAAAYVHSYLQQASPEERSQVLGGYFQNMPQEQRQQIGNAIVQDPNNPVQSVNANDPAELANAYSQAAQAPVQNGKSPLESAFGQGGMLSSPLVKAGLVGLAGVIGSQLLRGNR